MAFPEDIFTEQDASPDTLANLGPLRRLAGIWENRVTGLDINPKPEGPERRDYSGGGRPGFSPAFPKNQAF